ncbi:MAG: hypothetical protein PHS49_02785 [Candidatus Gracilibacteria bacterium]|nr:hypothetical protein [Candidatus Gracilibacteria bacterium]
MNTNRLISEFEHIYKIFFNKYDIVISSPIVVTLVGDISAFSKGNASILTQKITLRNYVGYNLNISSKEIEYIFRDNDKGFVTQNIENEYPINKKLLEKIGLNGDIGFLSEYNWNDPPSVLSNILTLKLLVDKEISVDDFDKFDMDNDEHNIYLNKVIELDKILYKEYNFFGGIRNNGLYIGTSFLASDSHLLALEKDNNYYYQNIGEYNDFNQLDLTFSLMSPNLVTKNNYNLSLLEDKNRGINFFINDFGIKGRSIDDVDLFQGINYVGNFYTLKVFQDLYRLYGSNYAGNNFYRDLKIYRESIKSLFDNNREELNDRFIRKQIIELLEDKNFTFYMDSLGVFGTIKFALVSQKVGYIDEELIFKLNKKTGFRLNLDYSSFYDGYERSGTKLEQYRTKGELSIFTADYALITYKSGEVKSISGDYVDFLGTDIKGLTLYMIKRRIYLDGEKLTSKEIHSQNTTIDIFEILLEKLGQDVSNKDLPKSSYSSNKNEMLGKIVLPILKHINDIKKQNFPLVCKGSITDFYMKLKESDFEINVIKKIN